jgi:hypothetical protein
MIANSECRYVPQSAPQVRLAFNDFVRFGPIVPRIGRTGVYMSINY